MSEDSNSRSAAGQGSTGEMSRPSNLQRIAQKKNQVRNYPRTKKLEKLAVYSSCKVSLISSLLAQLCCTVVEGQVQLPDTFRLFVCKCYWKTEFSLFYDADLWSAILTNVT